MTPIVFFVLQKFYVFCPPLSKSESPLSKTQNPLLKSESRLFKTQGPLFKTRHPFRRKIVRICALLQESTRENKKVQRETSQGRSLSTRVEVLNLTSVTPETRTIFFL